MKNLILTLLILGAFVFNAGAIKIRISVRDGGPNGYKKVIEQHHVNVFRNYHRLDCFDPGEEKCDWTQVSFINSGGVEFDLNRLKNSILVFVESQIEFGRKFGHVIRTDGVEYFWSLDDEEELIIDIQLPE